MEKQELVTELLSAGLPENMANIQSVGFVEQVVEQIIKSNPSNYLALYYLGAFCQKNNLIEKSLLAYEKVLVIYPDHFHTCHNLAVAHRLICNWELSKDFFERALSLRPFSSEALYNLALLHIQMDNKAEYQSVLSKLQTINKKLAGSLLKFRENYNKL